MTDRMPTDGGSRTATAARDERPVDGSSHAVHTDDIAKRFDEARDDRAMDRSGPGGAPTTQGHRDAAQTTPLVADEAAYRKRWTQVQTGFVDEPRRAVEQADALVAEVINELVARFSDERSRLEAQWSQGKDASTEDLRVAVQRYRSFFDRLVS